MPNTINDTKQLYSIARRVTALEKKYADNDELSRKITRKTDEDIAFRRDLNDLLYNLDSDNIPILNKVLKYQDDYATAIAEIRMEVSSQGASITQLVQFRQIVESAGYINSTQVEAIISASVNQYGGTINSYLRGNYYTQTEVNNQLITTSNTITNSITQSITQSGGSINSYLMGEFADQQSLAAISQLVSQNTAEIALIAQTGTMTGSMIIGAINNESYAVISADRISLAGKNINLTSDNITISSNYFNVDRYGNLTATSGTFTGTINATSGNITGTLYFGGNSNFYLSGSGTYRLYMYYDSKHYVTINSNGILAADACVFQTCTIGAELRIGDSGSYYGKLQYTSEFEISSTQGIYIATNRYINMVSPIIELDSNDYINLDAPFISLHGDIYINGVRVYQA